MATLTIKETLAKVNGKLSDTKADKVSVIAKLEESFSVREKVSDELRREMGPNSKPRLEKVFLLLKLHHQMVKLAYNIAKKCNEVAKLPESSEYYEKANMYRALAHSIDTNEVREETELLLHLKKEQLEEARRKE